MPLAMTQYYFLKDIINSLPLNVKNNLKYNNSLLFNVATFNDCGIFYKLFNPIKKDKYKINDKINSQLFNDFIIECSYQCKKNDNYKQLLFLYGIITNHILKENIDKYLSIRLNKKLTYDKACNIIDCYYAKLNDNLDLTKVAITDYFKDGFKYTDYMENMIHNPCIKVFSFFCTKTYFSHSLKIKKLYYKYFTRSKTKIKLFPYKIYDLIFNHRGKPKATSYIYTKKIDANLFNFNKKPYLINDITYNNSLDDVINDAKGQALEIIKSLNSYIFYDKDNFKEYLKKLED